MAQLARGDEGVMGAKRPRDPDTSMMAKSDVVSWGCKQGSEAAAEREGERGEREKERKKREREKSETARRLVRRVNSEASGGEGSGWYSYNTRSLVLSSSSSSNSNNNGRARRRETAKAKRNYSYTPKGYNAAEKRRRRAK